MRSRALGIYREEIYSNHAVDADHAILDSALDELEKLGVETIRAFPHQLDSEKFQRPGQVILTMAQGQEALKWIRQREKDGILTLNSVQSVENCYRVNLSHRLEAAEVGYPEFRVFDPSIQLSELPFPSISGYWVKRGDFHALSDLDVQYVRDLETMNQRFKDARERGIPSMILQKHVPGRIFKFYGVRGRFFDFRPMNEPFRNEDRVKTEIQVDADLLRKYADRAASVLDLDFFGGDGVVTESGSIHLIDMNDWPSFRSCREKAAKEMAAYTLQRLQEL